MKKLSVSKEKGLLSLLIIGVIAACALLCYQWTMAKWVALVAGIVLIGVLVFSDLKAVKRVPVLLVLGYVIFNGLTGFWAMSGKFFLREFSTLFIAASLFLIVVVWDQFGKTTLQKIMTVLATMGAAYSLISVELATTGLSAKVIKSVLNVSTSGMDFEAGTRLTGVFANANILSTILAVCIFLSVVLLQNAEEKKQRMFYSVLLSLNAFVMLLGFSMGGIASFVIAIVVYLIFAGKARGGALIRMLEGALSAMLWGFAAFPFFNQEGILRVLPLVFLAANALTVIVLEEKLAPKLTAVLEQRQKLVLVVLAVVVALGATYVVAGYHMSGPHTFDGSSLRRSAYPAAGAHVMEIEADGDVNVTIISQNMSQVMMHTNTNIYSGPADGAKFTVPEGSEVCYFTFDAAAGVTISEAKLDGGAETIRLNYTLLPGFIANRLQGLWANQNAIQRTVFFKDGMKLFAQSPVVGNGMGAFETGITSVQDFYYESRYIHNHYIQVLVEAGVIGLAFFVSALLGLAFLLFKNRRKETELSWAYPALWAALAMLAAHGVVEVSLSMVCVQCFAFVVYGLIVAACPPEVRVEETAEEEVPAQKPQKAKKNAKKEPVKVPTSVYVIKCVYIALPALFLVTLGMNMVAKKMMSSPAVSVDAYLERLEQAAELDPYEYNDAKLSYLYIVMDDPTPARVSNANRLAAELEQVQSNSLPRGLNSYYLATEQYEKAIHAANLATVYSATNAASWNGVITQMWSGFLGTENMPLTGENGDELLQGLVDYYERLQEHNRTSMETIQLSGISKQFFTEVVNMAAEPQNMEAIAGRLIYRSWLNCDADEDGVPDQISELSKAAVQENGAVVMEADGYVDIEGYLGATPAVRVVIECEQPDCVALVDIAQEKAATPYEVGEDRVVYLLLAGEEELAAEGFRISTSQAQTLERIEISTNMK